MRTVVARSLGSLLAAAALVVGAGAGAASAHGSGGAAPAPVLSTVVDPSPAAPTEPGQAPATEGGAAGAAGDSPDGAASASEEGADAGAGGAAAGGTGESIRVRVRTGDGEDVAGADITVEQEGAAVATGTTDDSGTAEIAVPGPGQYEVSLDEDSLSGDAASLAPRTNPIATTVDPGNPRAVAFRLEEEGASAAGRSGPGLSQIAQLVVNGLRFGLIIAMAAIGISLIFGTTGLTNFAHGELVTFGAMATYLANVVLGLPFMVSATLGLLASAAFGWLNERALWGPLRRRGTGLIAMMIVSIGLAFFLRYLFLFYFGGSSRAFAAYQSQAGIVLGPIRLRPVDMVSMALSVLVLVAVGIALLRTRLGKATRAVSDNPALAAASGIDVDRVVRVVWVAGAGLAGLAGILLGVSQGVTFQMGFQILLLVFAAVTLGGLGTAFGALVGSLIVGVFIEVSTLVVPTELKNVGALVILILILLVRPQGILGRAQRIG